MIKKFGILSCLALACAVVSPSVVRAQTNSGIILFGNRDETALEYCLDSGVSGRSDRYYLKVDSQKFKISEILITYNGNYNKFNENNGNFDTSEIKLRVASKCKEGGRELEVKSSTWDKEGRRLTIVPKEDIPAQTPIQVVLSYVRNPDVGGFYKFNARVVRNDGIGTLSPLIGTWIITFD
ncbi:MAG: DUF2808 domain-containing protein [Pseudanabaena sp.]